MAVTVRHCIHFCLLLFTMMTLLFFLGTTGQVSRHCCCFCILVCSLLTGYRLNLSSFLLGSFDSLFLDSFSVLRRVIRAMNMNNHIVALATVIVTRVRLKAYATHEQKSTIVTAFSSSHFLAPPSNPAGPFQGLVCVWCITLSFFSLFFSFLFLPSPSLFPAS